MCLDFWHFLQVKITWGQVLPSGYIICAVRGNVLDGAVAPEYSIRIPSVYKKQDWQVYSKVFHQIIIEGGGIKMLAAVGEHLVWHLWRDKKSSFNWNYYLHGLEQKQTLPMSASISTKGGGASDKCPGLFPWRFHRHVRNEHTIFNATRTKRSYSGCS